MATTYELKLYITAMTPKTEGQIEKLRQFYDKELAEEGYELKVVSILDEPQSAENDRILATPTLIKQLPEPVRRIIGDISNTEKIRLNLELK